MRMRVLEGAVMGRWMVPVEIGMRMEGRGGWLMRFSRSLEPEKVFILNFSVTRATRTQSVVHGGIRGFCITEILSIIWS
jgi:hypothetical protein